MSLELQQDLTSARQELDTARQELLANLDPLADDDLDRSRRGGWSVRRVVEHLIQAEWFYARAVTQLRGLAPAPLPEASDRLASMSDAVSRLAASRTALLTALADIDEPSFYRLGVVGHDEYSVLSVLENAAHHDQEHAQQLQAIVAAR